MPRRQTVPRLWLMTDERQGDALWAALERLPRRSGVVFRHYGLPAAERRLLFDAVRAVCRRRALVLIAAGGPLSGSRGSHRRRGRGLVTWPAHNLREIRAAERAGAHAIFLSPVHPTRSHPGRKALGERRFTLLARRTALPVIALGGMDGKKFARLRGAYGWAGIDAWD
ncbi:MAG TPA: thiamine phosphate synthase [Allosphingosinicella sp.]|nr:thiamine phosphate synthase [Allosphingosinicella sp.]